MYSPSTIVFCVLLWAAPIVTSERLEHAPWPPPALRLYTSETDRRSADTLTRHVMGAHIGTVRVSIPDGMKLVAGNTMIHSERRHSLFDSWPPDPVLRVCAVRPGKYEIRCTKEFQDSGWTESAEASIRVVADRFGVHAETSALHRWEMIRDGRRYRLARGGWLVPLAAGEGFDLEDYLRHGRPPRVTRSPHARCHACRPNVPDTVSFWVLLDARGRVIAARPLEGKAIDAVDVATAALSKGRYRPARIGRRKVSDVCLVRVRLE